MNLIILPKRFVDSTKVSAYNGTRNETQVSFFKTPNRVSNNTGLLFEFSFRISNNQVPLGSIELDPYQSNTIQFHTWTVKLELILLHDNVMTTIMQFKGIS